MKGLIFSIFLILSVSCFAQIQKPLTKGNSILSGGGTIQYQKDKYSNNTGSSKTSLFFITINPGFGYFIINDLATGVNVYFSYNGAGDNKFYSLGIGPFVRYYFDNGIFVKADLGYSILHNISLGTANQNFFMITPGVGYAFFLNSKVSLDPCLCYEFDNINLNSTNNHKINAVRLELKLTIFK